MLVLSAGTATEKSLTMTIAANRVTGPAKTLVDVLRYHAEWSTNESSHKAEDIHPSVYGSILAEALVDGLVEVQNREFITTAAGLEVIRDSVRTDADALRDTANHHQGTRVHAADKGHQRDLRRQGLVGPRGGLTRRGSIAAERLRNAALDDAFGPL